MSDAAEVARQRARTFLEPQADALARAALAALLAEGPAADVQRLLAARQAPEGCFPAHGDTPLVATRRALSLLDDLRALSGDLVDRACAWLDRAQADDGGFEPAAPLEARLVETGLLLGHLARTRCSRTSLLEAAADFLARGFAPERVQGFRWRPIAAYASAFSSFPHDASDEILQWCGRELERGFRTNHFDAVATARVLVACDAPALPGARLSAGELVPLVLASQSEDGGWPGPEEAGTDERIGHSWDALVVLARLA